MYRLATMLSVTDRQTDRRHDHANSRSHHKAVRSAKKLELYNLTMKMKHPPHRTRTASLRASIDSVMF